MENSCWKVCNDTCNNLKHGITKEAFIALLTSQVVWLVCLCVSLCVSLSVSTRGYLRNYTCDLCRMFAACCLWSWLDLRPAKGAKSAIYDCFVCICTLMNIYTVATYSSCQILWPRRCENSITQRHRSSLIPLVCHNAWSCMVSRCNTVYVVTLV